jgi:hypothetical protein
MEEESAEADLSGCFDQRSVKFPRKNPGSGVEWSKMALFTYACSERSRRKSAVA